MSVMIIKMLLIHATVILSVGTVWGLIMYFYASVVVFGISCHTGHLFSYWIA